MGYSSNQKGYRCFEPLTQKVYISHSVVFDETRFPAMDKATSHGSCKITVPTKHPVMILPPQLHDSQWCSTTSSTPLLSRTSQSNTNLSISISPSRDSSGCLSPSTHSPLSLSTSSHMNSSPSSSSLLPVPTQSPPMTSLPFITLTYDPHDHTLTNRCSKAQTIP